MTNYDFSIAWNWEYDSDFIGLLECACRQNSLTLLNIIPDNLNEILHSLENGIISFKVFFDRASDTDKHFIPVDQWAHDNDIFRINAHEIAVRSWSKAIIHFELINAGVQTPYTIIIPPYEKQPDLKEIDLSLLGENFFIKPAHGGGGEGIIREATSFNQVLIARQVKPADYYLLQAHIFPVQLDTRPAWFRIIYCTGKVYLSWWNPHSHVYIPVTTEEEKRYNMYQIHNITNKIAHVCELELFSTEIALTPDDIFVVIDYINDQIDLRLKSKAIDGVPDDFVYDISGRLIDLVATHSG